MKQNIEGWVVARNASGDQTAEHYRQPGGVAIRWLDQDTTWTIKYDSTLKGSQFGSHARVNHVYSGDRVPPPPQDTKADSNSATSSINHLKFHKPHLYKITTNDGVIAWLEITGVAPDLTEMIHFNADLLRPCAGAPAVVWTIAWSTDTPDLSTFQKTQTVTVALPD